MDSSALVVNVTRRNCILQVMVVAGHECMLQRNWILKTDPNFYSFLHIFVFLVW